MGACCFAGGCSYGKYGMVLLAVAGTVATFGFIQEPEKKPTSTPAVTPQDAAPKKDVPVPAEGVKDGKKVEQAKAPENFFDFTMKTIDGESQSLSAYKGKVVLIVNTASECGYTPQYEGLQKLYADNKDKGLVVLAFPSNDFMGQEPGSSSEIKAFCESKYKVTFPIFEKIEVSGSGAHPLYKWLSTQKGGGPMAPKWNFSKYLVDHTGQVVGGFGSSVKPGDKSLNEKIATLLAAAKPSSAGSEKSAPPPAEKK